MEKIFWLKDREGAGWGGIYFRDADLVEFIKKVEKKVGKVIGIKFNGSYDIELITEIKKEGFKIPKAIWEEPIKVEEKKEKPVNEK